MAKTLEEETFFCLMNNWYLERHNMAIRCLNMKKLNIKRPGFFPVKIVHALTSDLFTFAPRE